MIVADAMHVRAARAHVCEILLAARSPEGHWVGELSSSALSTATAVTALAIFNRDSHCAALISRGLDWLAQHQNSDGGWGDTTRSISNLSTSALCWAAFGAVPGADAKYRSVVAAVER